MAIRQAVVANRCTRIMLVPARRIVAAALVWVVVTLIAAVPRVLIAQAEDLGNATHNGPPPIASDELSSALSQFNRGAALLEQYRYSEAAEALENVVRLFPQWTAAARGSILFPRCDRAGQGG